MRFRKKPVVIEAVCWDGTNGALDEIADLALDCGRRVQLVGANLEIPTLEGVMTARFGDWIIKGVNGEVYPCKPDIFEKTYEPELMDEDYMAALGPCGK
jgi:hypothetical protein